MNTLNCKKSKLRTDAMEVKWDIETFPAAFEFAGRQMSSDKYRLDTSKCNGLELRRLKNNLSVTLGLDTRGDKLRFGVDLRWNLYVDATSNATVSVSLELLRANNMVCLVKDLWTRKMERYYDGDLDMLGGGDYDDMDVNKDNLLIDLFSYDEFLQMKDLYFADDVLRIRLKLTFSEVSVADVTNEEIKLNDGLGLEKLKLDAQTNFMQAFKNLKGLKETCDAKIQCGAELFPVHKVVLTARSPVFARMLVTAMKESQTNEIKIEDVQPDVLSTLLDFLYGAEMPSEELGVDKLCGVVVAADKYEVLELKKYCLDEMIGKMDCKNFGQIAMTFRLFPDEKKNQEAVWDFCSRKWLELRHDPKLVKLTRDYPDAFFAPIPEEN